MSSIFDKLFNDDDINISEESFQKYSKFYGNTVPVDDDFNNKINKILDFIINKKETDMKVIAKEVGCSEAECVIKIKYLKNKRLIGDYYIDTNTMRIFPCSENDQVLLNKYKPYIYGNHFSIDEMASRIYVETPHAKSVEDIKNKVFSDLKYLDSKNLLNGIKLIDVDKRIVYYAVEKHKDSNLSTVHCPNCGALNDVDLGNKVRCSYCNTIING